MLSLFKAKPKAAVQTEPGANIEAVDGVEDAPVEPVRRMKQQNIKASEDCSMAFAAIAQALGMTKAELFEDLVAERFETLRRQGVKLEGLAG
jgi:hypothetical protein